MLLNALAVLLSVPTPARSSFGSVAGPTWWRLVCNSTTVDPWRLCDLRFFVSRDCSRAPPSSIAGRFSSENETSIFDGPRDAVFAEWSSNCTACEAGEAFMGAQYEKPVVVHCVSFRTCAGGGPGNAEACSSVKLQRSSDGSSWFTIASWGNPRPDVKLSLTSATYRPVGFPPTASVYVPASQVCSLCAARPQLRISALANIQVTFSKRVYPGGGMIVLDRGGLVALALAAVDENWFEFSGARLTVRPQQPLGASSTCTSVSFAGEAVSDENGFHVLDFPYRLCLADTSPPVLHSTDPPAGSILGLNPTISILFQEEVQIVSGGPAASIVPVLSTSPTFRETIDFSLNGAWARTSLWDATNRRGVLQIDVVEQLHRGTGYELRIPAGAVTDVSGNVWSGTAYSFGTQNVAPTPSPAPSPPSLTQSAQESPSDDGTTVTIVVVVCVALLVLGAGGAGLLICRAWARTETDSYPSPKATRVGASPWKKADSQESHSAPSTSYVGAARAKPGAVPSRGEAWAEAPGHGSRWEAPAQHHRHQRPDQQQRPRPHEANDASTAKPQPARGRSFVDDSAVGGDWVRVLDEASGRPYWYHNKTRETRWDPPPKNQSWDPPPKKSASPSSGSVPKARHRPRAKPNPQPKMPGQVDDSEPESPSPESQDSPENARVKADIYEQLHKTRDEDIASRRKTFKFLLLRWHPDKNKEDPDLATAMFQFLQEQKPWYLKE